jgi:hypothetical protein
MNPVWVITEWDYITGSHLKGVATDEEIALRLNVLIGTKDEESDE